MQVDGVVVGGNGSRQLAAGSGGQWRTVVAAEREAVVEVPGVEATGRCQQGVLRLEAAGAGSRQRRTVEATAVVAVVEGAGREAAGRCQQVVLRFTPPHEEETELF